MITPKEMDLGPKQKISALIVGLIVLCLITFGAAYLLSLRHAPPKQDPVEKVLNDTLEGFADHSQIRELDNVHDTVVRGMTWIDSYCRPYQPGAWTMGDPPPIRAERKGYTNSINDSVVYQFDTARFFQQFIDSVRCNCPCHTTTGIIHFVPCCNKGWVIKQGERRDSL